MARTFEFDLRGDPKAKLKVIKTAAAKKGIVFRGDTKKGSFHKDVNLVITSMRVLEGSYFIKDERIRITVKDLPPTYTWERVESELRQFIESE
jgi:hypothetical protein